MIRYLSFACPPKDEEDAACDMANFLSDVPGLEVLEFSTIKVLDGRMIGYGLYKGRNHEDDMEELIGKDGRDKNAALIWQKEARYYGDTLVLTGVAGNAIVSVIGPVRAVQRFTEWLVRTAGAYGWEFDKTF